MEKIMLEKLDNIEKMLSVIIQNKNIKYAFINENSNELWNGYDICNFMNIWVNEFLSIASRKDFPKCIIDGKDLFDTKWRSGSIITWIKEQESKN